MVRVPSKVAGDCHVITGFSGFCHAHVSTFTAHRPPEVNITRPSTFFYEGSPPTRSTRRRSSLTRTPSPHDGRRREFRPRKSYRPSFVLPWTRDAAEIGAILVESLRDAVTALPWCLLYAHPRAGRRQDRGEPGRRGPAAGFVRPIRAFRGEVRTGNPNACPRRARGRLPVSLPGRGFPGSITFPFYLVFVSLN